MKWKILLTLTLATPFAAWAQQPVVSGTTTTSASGPAAIDHGTNPGAGPNGVGAAPKTGNANQGAGENATMGGTAETIPLNGSTSAKVVDPTDVVTGSTAVVPSTSRTVVTSTTGSSAVPTPTPEAAPNTISKPESPRNGSGTNVSGTKVVHPDTTSAGTGTQH